MGELVSAVPEHLYRYAGDIQDALVGPRAACETLAEAIDRLWSSGSEGLPPKPDVADAAKALLDKTGHMAGWVWVVAQVFERAGDAQARSHFEFGGCDIAELVAVDPRTLNDSIEIVTERLDWPTGAKVADGDDLRTIMSAGNIWFGTGFEPPDFIPDELFDADSEWHGYVVASGEVYKQGDDPTMSASGQFGVPVGPAVSLGDGGDLRRDFTFVFENEGGDRIEIDASQSQHITDWGLGISFPVVSQTWTFESRGPWNTTSIDWRLETKGGTSYDEHQGIG